MSREYVLVPARTERLVLSPGKYHDVLKAFSRSHLFFLSYVMLIGLRKMCKGSAREKRFSLCRFKILYIHTHTYIYKNIDTRVLIKLFSGEMPRDNARLGIYKFSGEKNIYRVSTIATNCISRNTMPAETIENFESHRATSRCPLHVYL